MKVARRKEEEEKAKIEEAEEKKRHNEEMRRKRRAQGLDAHAGWEGIEAEVEEGKLRLPLLMTSRYIFKEPLAKDGFTLTDLEANTGYDIMIRTHSTSGTSIPSETLEVRTANPEPPGECLYFGIDYDVDLADNTTRYSSGGTVVGLRTTPPLLKTLLSPPQLLYNTTTTTGTTTITTVHHHHHYGLLRCNAPTTTVPHRQLRPSLDQASSVWRLSHR